MKLLSLATIVATLCLSSASAMAASTFTTKFVQLQGSNSLGLLYEPTPLTSNTALIFEHPDRNNFTDAVAQQIATRGYRILMVDNRADRDSGDSPEESYLPSISQGIAYLRNTVHASKVVLIGHSGGGHLAALYQNVAENGPGACSGPEKIYPCETAALGNLQKPDGFILLDGTLGGAHQTSAVDPATPDNRDDRHPLEPRNRRLDFLNPANGFISETAGANYPQAFRDRFYKAQSARSNDLINDALNRLTEINNGRGAYSNDEPLVLNGVGIRALGARLYQPDRTIVSHTKAPHVVLKADGTRPVIIFTSVRPVTANHASELRELGSMSYQTTVRGFLANSAVRTDPNTYAFTEDDIKGVIWESSVTSTPSNARGIHVPALIMNMGCHYLMVPGEIIFNNLASVDKSYAGVEGAVHTFTACRPEYGDTRKRVFDYVSEWLTLPGRF